MSAFRFVARRLFAVGSGGAGVLIAAVAASPSASQEPDKIHVPYVLVGGGTASYYAALAIRARDPDARVLIIGNESESPYNRSILSKEFWWYGDSKTPKNLSYHSAASGRRRDIRYEADGFYPSLERLIGSDEFPHGAVSLLRGATVVRIDSNGRFVTLKDGRQVGFDKCLIATGSRPKTIPFLENKQFSNRVTVLHNIDDFRRLYEAMERPSQGGFRRPRKVAVIGGGLMGTELAYSLQRRYGVVSTRSDPVEVYQIVNDNGILAGVLPPVLVAHATKQTEYIGINVITDCEVESVEEGADDTVKVVLKKSGDVITTLNFDHIIIDGGAVPNVDLARYSGLPLDDVLGGVKADAEFRVVDSIWAAGDVCAFEDSALHRRRRLEHLEHAQTTGRFAGANMAGARKTYTHQAGFDSIFGRTEHIHAVGEIDANALENITYIIHSSPRQDSENTKKKEADDAQDDYLRAIVFYMDKAIESQRRVLGVLLLNILSPMAVEMARKIICDEKLHSNEELNDLVKLVDVFSENDIEEEESENSSKEDDDKNKTDV